MVMAISAASGWASWQFLWVSSAGVPSRGGGTQAEISAHLGTLPCVYMSLASQIPPLSGVPNPEKMV